jgi:hypothetical protein
LNDRWTDFLNFGKGFNGMVLKRYLLMVGFIFLGLAAGCRAAEGGRLGASQSAGLPAVDPQAAIPSATVTAPAEVFLPAINAGANPAQVETQTPTTAPSSTIPPAPMETESVFEVGREITIEYLRELEISGSEITFERQIANGPNYFQHIVSYVSEGNRIYGLLTIPFGEPPRAASRPSFSTTVISRPAFTRPPNATLPTSITWQGAVLWSSRSIYAAMGIRRATRKARISRPATPSTRSRR